MEMVENIIIYNFLGTFSIIGKPVITNENYQDTENKYKIPNEVIKVADIILNDSRREVKVIAPEEISTWIREYSAEIITSIWERIHIWL